MYKRNTNIVFGIIMLFSLIQLLIFFEIIPVSETLLKNSILVYIFLVVAGSFAMTKFVEMLHSKKPKGEVKIIYKKFDKEDVGTDIVVKKSKEKVDKIVSSVFADLDDIDNDEKFSEILLRNFSKTFNIVQGIVYIRNKNIFSTSNTYAFYQTETAKSFEIGEGITGQVAKNQKFLYIDNVPENYIRVLSGLGDGSPKYLVFLPIVKENQTIAVIECASFTKLPAPTEDIFNKIAKRLMPYFDKFV